MSHTPGPWTVEVAESEHPGLGSDVVRVDVMKGDKRVAGVTVRPGSRALSNAALIAAAPELLEALEALKAVVKEDLLPIAYEHGGELWMADTIRIESVFGQVDAALAEGATP